MVIECCRKLAHLAAAGIEPDQYPGALRLPEEVTGAPRNVRMRRGLRGPRLTGDTVLFHATVAPA